LEKGFSLYRSDSDASEKSDSFAVELSLAYDDLHCQEIILSELLQIAFEHCSDFSGIDQGATTASGIFDEGIAPQDRDLSNGKPNSPIKFHFQTLKGAERFVELLRDEAGIQSFPKILKVASQDWNQAWRDSFQGVDIPPCWRIQPVWREKPQAQPHQEVIWMNPSLGFGTGEHPTTQLCLEAIGDQNDLQGRKVLDFGAGSGILAVAAAKRGAFVSAVEIDSLALESAKECATINHVSEQIHFSKDLATAIGRYDLIVANILRNVLLDYAEILVSRLRPGGSILLSGILEIDRQDVLSRYQSLMGEGVTVKEMKKGDWLALLFQSVSSLK